MKKALVSLPDKVWDIIQNELKGKLGQNNSEIIRGIVLAYLSEKGYMEKEKSALINIPRKERNPTRELAEELDVFDEMLDFLVDLLEEKGILTHEEWEERIKRRLEKSRGRESTSYRELEFKG